VTGAAPNLREGTALAEHALDSGKAMGILERLRAIAPLTQSHDSRRDPGETKRTVGYCRFRLPLAELEKQATASPPPCSFGQAIHSAKGMACIAEFKRRSPSKGFIQRDADVARGLADL